jgi:hypothetical protein
LAGDRGFPYGLNEKTLNRVITLFTEIVMARETRDRPFRLPPICRSEQKRPPSSGGLCAVSKSVLLFPIAVHHGSTIIVIAEGALS